MPPKKRRTRKDSANRFSRRESTPEEFLRSLPQNWKGHLESWATSNQPPQVYCKLHDLNYNTGRYYLNQRNRNIVLASLGKLTDKARSQLELEAEKIVSDQALNIATYKRLSTVGRAIIGRSIAAAYSFAEEYLPVVDGRVQPQPLPPEKTQAIRDLNGLLSTIKSAALAVIPLPIDFDPNKPDAPSVDDPVDFHDLGSPFIAESEQDAHHAEGDDQPGDVD